MDCFNCPVCGDKLNCNELHLGIVFCDTCENNGRSFDIDTGSEEITRNILNGYHNDYLYSSFEEYEKILGYQVNESVRIGWNSARVTNKQIKSLFGVEDV